jgi:hypothetical protein
MNTRQRLNEVHTVYRDPARLFGRSGPKLSADLVIVALATLEEIVRLRELLEDVLRHPERPASVGRSRPSQAGTEQAVSTEAPRA